MRVLWVYEVLTPQMVALATEVSSQPDIELEIMTSGQLPAQLAHLAAPRMTCRSKVDLNARLKIRQQLKVGYYDVAHAYTSRNMANLAGACWGVERLPKLIGYRGTVTRLSPFDPANWLTFWHPRFTSIVCVCNATRAALRASGIADRKLQVIWEGCDRDALVTPHRDTLSDLGIPNDAFVVGTVANARRVKGIDLMVRSAIELANENEIYWLVVGAIVDPQVRRLAEDERLKGRVKLIGPRPHGGGFSSLFDIYLAPSRQEGLSMGIMEAMTQAVCPVVTSVGGNAELIRHGVDGLVIPPEDPAAISRAVRHLWQSPEKRAKLAASSHRRACQQFSIEAWSQRLCTMYRSLVDKNQLSRRRSAA